MIWLWPGSLAQKLKPLPNAERHQMRLNDAPTVNNVDSGNRISLANSHEPGTHLNEQFFVGRVLAVTPLRVNGQLMQATGMVSRQQLVTVTVAEGPLKGITAKVINEVTDNPAFNVEVKPGQEVILSLVSGGSGETEINIADYNRAPALLILLAVFLVVFLVLGGKTGLKSLAGLAISVFLIVAVLLPLSLKGVYPLATAVGICIVAAVASMLFVAGFSAKALAAIVGIVGGVVISGIASSLTIAFAPLTGLSSEEAQILRGSVLGLPASFYSGLLAAGMLIGALGVIMDVAISIASSVREIANANRDLPLQVLYSSGMNIGKDIMGTMTNTLVLAYVGSALPLLLLTSQMPASKLVNLDIFATEIAASLCGSLGLICTIPLTAIAAAALMAKRLQGDSDGQGNENSRENSDAKASLNSTFKKDVEDREIEQSLAGVDLFKTDLSRQSQDTGS
jgi:uncharacterized membrane protein